MKQHWITILLHFDATIFRAKQKLWSEQHGLSILWWGFLIVAGEIALALLSFPLYFFLNPKELKARGASDGEVHTYQLRRKVTVSLVLTTILLLLIKLTIGGVIIVKLFPAQRAKAANVTWGFDRPTDYIYDASKVQIVDGIVYFKATNPPAPTALPLLPTTAPLLPTSLPPSPILFPTIAPTSPPPLQPTATSIPPTNIPPTAVPTTVPPTSIPPTLPPIVPTIPSLLWNLYDNRHANLVRPISAQEQTCETTIQPVHSLVVDNLDHWVGLSEVAVKNGGEIVYELSDNDGITWRFWHGSAWVETSDQWNTGQVVNEHISVFPSSSGHLLFRAKLQSTCTMDMQIISLTVDYDLKSTPTLTLTPTTLPLQPTEEVVVTLSLGQPTSPLPTPTLALSFAPTEEISLSILPSPLATLEPIPTSSQIPFSTTSIQASLSATFTPTPGVITAATPLIGIVGGGEIPNSGGLNLPNTFSITGDVELEALGTNTPIVSKPQAYEFGININNHLYLTVYGTDGKQETLETSNVPLVISTHAVAATYDGSTFNLYIDGALTTTKKDVQIDIARSLDNIHVGAEQVILYNQPLTPEQIATTYLTQHNTPPQIVITGLSQENNGDVTIQYVASDKEKNVVDLVTHEYSISNAFNGEQRVMSADISNPLHELVNSLSTDNNGLTHTFVWNAQQDLPDFVGDVFVRLQAKDSLAQGTATTSAAFVLDTKAPNVTIHSVKQLTPSGNIQIQYDLEDNHPNNITIQMEGSSDGGITWTIPTSSTTGDIGTSVAAGKEKSIIWQVEKDFPDHEHADILIRFRATDQFGNTALSTVSPNFAIDTKAPFGLANFHGVIATPTSITWAWTPVSVEANFDHYELWYGINETDVEQATGSAKLWGKGDDSGLKLSGTAATVVTDLVSNAHYFAKVVAVDTFDHKTSLPPASFSTSIQIVISPTPIELPTLIPTIVSTATLAPPPTVIHALVPTVTEIPELTAPSVTPSHIPSSVLHTPTISVPTPTEELPTPTELHPTLTAIPTHKPLFTEIIDTITEKIGDLFGLAPTPVIEPIPSPTEIELRAPTIEIIPSTFEAFPLLPTSLPTSILLSPTPVILEEPSPTPIPLPTPTPTPQPVLNQIVENIIDSITGLFGSTPNPTPSLAPPIPTTIVSSPTPELLPTASETLPAPSIVSILPTIILSTVEQLSPQPTAPPSLTPISTEIPPLPTPTPQAFLNNVVDSIVDTISNLFGQATPTPTIEPLPTTPLPSPTLTVPSEIPTSVPPSIFPTLTLLSPTPTLHVTTTSLSATLSASLSATLAILSITPPISLTLTPSPILPTIIPSSQSPFQFVINTVNNLVGNTSVNPTTTPSPETSTSNPTNIPLQINNTNIATSSTTLTLTTVSPQTIRLVDELNQAKQSPLVPAPTVTTVTQPVGGNTIQLSGQGIPNADIVLFIFSDQAIITRVKVKEDGTWNYTDEQSLVELSPGVHTVYALTMDRGSNVKSKPVLVKSFEVKRNPTTLLLRALDLPTTLLTFALLVLGIWWLRSRKTAPIPTTPPLTHLPSSLEIAPPHELLVVEKGNTESPSMPAPESHIPSSKNIETSLTETEKSV